MIKEQCLWNVAIKMNSSIDSTLVRAQLGTMTVLAEFKVHAAEANLLGSAPTLEVNIAACK